MSSLEDDIESIQDNLAKRCISQDFISEMREAFHLFDKVTGETYVGVGVMLSKCV